MYTIYFDSIHPSSPQVIPAQSFLLALFLPLTSAGQVSQAPALASLVYHAWLCAFFLVRIILSPKCTMMFFHSTVDRHLGYFQLGAPVN